MGGNRLSAGVIVVRPEAMGHRYLLLRAYQYWDFPKGMVEPGETPLAAARREVWEETTLTDLAFRWGEEFRDTPPYRKGKVARYYLAECRNGTVALPPSAELGRPEHDEFRWVSFGEALELLSPRVRPILRWAEETIRRGAAAD